MTDLALAQAHTAVQGHLRRLVADYVATAWEGLPGYDERDLAAWLEQVVPLVDAAQRQAVTLAQAYIAQALGGVPLGITPEADIGAAARGGTPVEEVYRRPFVSVWTALSRGIAFADAVKIGLERATSTAETDVQLAMRSAVRTVGEADTRVAGYARDPNSGACDLCLMASTQRYRVGDLMPIHNRCGCGVRVLAAPAGAENWTRRERDEWWRRNRVVDRQRLDELKQSGAAGELSLQQAASRARRRAAGAREQAADASGARRAELEARADRDDQLAADYRARLAERRAGTRVAVHEHGELGPVLADEHHAFTGPEQIA